MKTRMWLFLLAGLSLGADDPDEKGKKVAEALRGEWVVERAEELEQEGKGLKGRKVVVAGNKLTLHAEERTEFVFKRGADGPPAEMDLYEGDVLVSRSIYELDGGTLRLCVGLTHRAYDSLASGGKPTSVQAGDRPTAFDSRQGVIIVLKRSK